MAAGSTYTPIATQTASGSVSQILFTSIPQTYTDLILVIQATESGQDGMDVQVGNGSIDTGNNYSNTYLRGNGSSAVSYRTSNYYSFDTGIVNTTVDTIIVQLQNYSNTTTYKSMLSRSSSTASALAVAGTWRNTVAINQISIKNGSVVNHGAGSTFTLYGIAAA